MNIAVREARKIDDFDCFIFHDVDLIPENDHNVYECYAEPRHLCPAVDELRYSIMYYNLVGGVLALNNEHLTKTNGFSNLYWGWGNFCWVYVYHTCFFSQRHIQKHEKRKMFSPHRNHDIYYYFSKLVVQHTK